MSYLYESTKLNSVRPVEDLISVLCSSIVWNRASCVKVPSVKVSRHGLVTPLLVCLLPTTLAFRRNCSIWSLLRFGSSAATTKCLHVRYTTTRTDYSSDMDRCGFENHRRGGGKRRNCEGPELWRQP